MKYLIIFICFIIIEKEDKTENKTYDIYLRKDVNNYKIIKKNDLKFYGNKTKSELVLSLFRELRKG